MLVQDNDGERRLPTVVEQALSNYSLAPTARQAMWELRGTLSLTAFREVKVAALAHAMHCKERTLVNALAQLVAEGYLDEHKVRKPRALRFPSSRRASIARAA